MKLFQKLKETEDPVKRRALFVALLSGECEKTCGEMPIVVGGEALEIYTQGGYTTGDIDLKGPKDCMEGILKEWGFSKKGRLWFNPDLDIYIDWLGAELDEGPEAAKRTNTVVLDKDLTIRIISVEDLIIDRLNAAKWWKDTDSLMWAEVLVRVKEATGQEIDVEYLRKRATQEGLEELLQKVLKDR
ncbi:MAG: hypothetical protein D6778_09735 [Nitrospirae bacterium]|nr:MAG: hypothetical protein D6778_09735 [Nitrospirota bacterium]